MTKPWEEDWELRHEGAVVGVAGQEEKDIASAPYGSEAPDLRARLRFLSAAPDMARLLLELEWADGERAACPICGGWMRRADETRATTADGSRIGHERGCRLLAALTKAGIR